MKKVLLKSIELLNFKGIEHFKVDFSTDNTSILGKNGSGKTTIMDAFNWCLFGKNAANKQDFSIKTLTTSGEPIYKLDHSVEVELQIGTDLYLIKRILKEQWKREAGTATESFKNSTGFFINNINMKEKEFIKNITQLLGTEEDIKILSSTTFFNQMDWKERREYIFKNCEIPSEEEILNKNPEFQDVIGLDVVTLNSKIKELEKKKAEIPAKIEELSSMIVNFDTEKLQAEKTALEAELLNNDTSIKTTEIKNKLLQIKMEVSNTKANLIEEMNKLKIIFIQKQNLEKNLLSYKEQKDEIDKGLVELRQAYVKVHNEKLEIAENSVCPTCGQILAGENLQKHLTEMQTKFEIEKKQKLLTITSQGKPLRQTSDRLQADISRIEEELKDIAEKNIAEKEIELQNTLNSLDLKNNSEYLRYEEELNQITTSSGETDKEIKQARLAEVNNLLVQVEYSKKVEAKIKKLRENEKLLVQEIVNIECQLMRISEFQKIKIKEVETAINSQFINVKFNLFKTALNGSVSECCEILVKGVPFADVNTAGKINAALEIIKVFSGRTGIYYPIFIDNRESVTTIIDVGTQIINLKVSDDEELKIVA